MQKIERLIECNSSLYDIELLKKELVLIKESINEKDNTYQVLDIYRNSYLEKINSFNSEFRFLNEYNYSLLNNIKNNKIDVESKDMISLAIETEKQIVKNIKDTLQNIVNEKERVLSTYKLLLDFIQGYIEKEGVLV